jgi:hypothetical protein
MQTKSFILKALRAFGLDGAIVKAGELVEVAENEAKNLLARGRAELATEGDSALQMAAPTRNQLDVALAALPGDQTDADYVVRGMRGHFGELFTSDDEAAVRELVKSAEQDEAN